ncbi:MAG: hypothetical protein U0Z26_10520 [Anaerolineales bacterium]
MIGSPSAKRASFWKRALFLTSFTAFCESGTYTAILIKTVEVSVESGGYQWM